MEEALFKILLVEGKEAALKWLGEEILIDYLMEEHEIREVGEAMRAKL